MARWWQLTYFFNKFIPKIGEDDFQFDYIICFKLGWFNNQRVMGFFLVRFTNLLHQPTNHLRRRLRSASWRSWLAWPPWRKFPWKPWRRTNWSTSENGVGGGGKGRGIFNGSWSILRDFFGKGLAIEKRTKEDVLDCFSEFERVIFNKMLIEDVDLETQCHTKKWHQNPVDQILSCFSSPAGCTMFCQNVLTLLLFSKNRTSRFKKSSGFSTEGLNPIARRGSSWIIHTHILYTHHSLTATTRMMKHI